MPDISNLLLVITVAALVAVVFISSKKDQRHNAEIEKLKEEAEEKLAEIYNRFADKVNYDLVDKLHKIGDKLEEMEKHQQRITMLQKELNNQQEHNLRLNNEITKLQAVLTRKTQQLQRLKGSKNA